MLEAMGIACLSNSGRTCMSFPLQFLVSLVNGCSWGALGKLNAGHTLSRQKHEFSNANVNKGTWQRNSVRRNSLLHGHFQNLIFCLRLCLGGCLSLFFGGWPSVQEEVTVLGGLWFCQ